MQTQIQNYILQWLYKHQHTILTKSMLLKLKDFQNIDSEELLSSIYELSCRGLLTIQKLSQGPRAFEIIKISDHGRTEVQTRFAKIH